MNSQVPTPLPAADRISTVVIWLLLSCLAFGTCSLIWPAAHLGDEYLPVGNDSFYHARRILDAVANPEAFYEFDPKIHAPEGSLLTWPWGYDYALARIVWAGMQVGIAEDPMAILIWIPTAAVFISMGLLVLIMRQLGFSQWTTVLGGICYGLLPLTQYLHGVGFIDHHYAEHIFVLATLAAALRWLHAPASIGRAAMLGVVLGIAPAVHNALFILQLPVLIVVFARWLQGREFDIKAAVAFGTGLLTATLGILIPSEPFQARMFEYYLLSWFHLYVAVGTVIAITFMSRIRYKLQSCLALTAIGAALVAPLAYQINQAQSFLVGDLTRLDAIAEMKSILELARLYGWMDMTNRFSWLVWAIPLTLSWCIYRGWKERGDYTIIFWVFCVLGISLMLMQFRLHYFGSYALYLPWLLAIDRFVREKPEWRKQILLGASLVILLAYSAPMRNQLLGPMRVANDMYFQNLRPVLNRLADACESEPGIVLADNDAGHYIRFFTDCSVVANNFLLTAQHGEKILEMDRLLSMSSEEFPVAAPYISYVLVRPASITSPGDDSVQYMSFSPASSELVADLLLSPHEKEPFALPPAYELLHEAVLTNESGEKYPYARLYRIHHSRDAGKPTNPARSPT